MRLILIALIIGFAVFALAAPDPPKPQPATAFTLSVFTVSVNTSFGLNSIYYDQTNQKLRMDDIGGNYQVQGEFIGLWNSNNGYRYDTASGKCTAFSLTQPWVNIWDFLKTATYGGPYPWTTTQKCDMWVTNYDDGFYRAFCFNGNTPLFYFIYNLSQSMLVSTTYITSYVPSVDPAAFDLPNSCSSSLKMTAIKDLEFDIPTHPLFGGFRV